MKRIITLSLILFAVVNVSLAQAKQAEIKFESTTHNFGRFTSDDAVQKCVFTFTNTGNAPLIINQAIASCGCTVPSYTKEPVKPGEKGTIKVTYNGKGMFPSHFKKSITIRSNAVTEMVRLYIEGELSDEKKASKQ